MTVYTFTVVAYNDEGTSSHQESGLLYADSYSNAVTQLEYYYGSDLIRILSISDTNKEMAILPANVIFDFTRNKYDDILELPCNIWGELNESSMPNLRSI